MPKIKLSDIRREYPEYDSLSNDQLLIGLRRSQYPTLTPAQFNSIIDYDT